MDEHLKLPHKTDLDAASVVKSGTMVALQRLEEDQPAGSLTTSHPDVTDSFAERGPEMAGMSRVEELLALPASEANPPIQAATESGEDLGDSYSDYSETASQTTSLRSSLFEYTYENGRRYHAYKAGQYLLPNDEMEQDRLDMTHHVFTLTLNGEPCVTQLDNPQEILDIGTGTGMWAIEMGDLYPSAQVIGTDLSPIQAEWVPPNVHFEIDDATLEWTFPLNHFDFIHARTLAGAIRDWPALLRQCVAHLKPGGKVEISEGRADFFCDDGSLAENTATHRWLTEFRRLAAPLGFDIAPQLPDLMKHAGLTNVAYVQKTVPLGTWPKDPALKEIGRWFRAQFVDMALESYSLALFTRMGGWSNEEAQVLFAMVRNELKTNKIHLYTYTAFITGTKPLDGL